MHHPLRLHLISLNHRGVLYVFPFIVIFYFVLAFLIGTVTHNCPYCQLVMPRQRRDSPHPEYRHAYHDCPCNHGLNHIKNKRNARKSHLEKPAPKSRAPYRSIGLIGVIAVSLLFAHQVDAVHHLEKPAIHYVSRRDSSRPLTITNLCPDVIYPAILTVSGVGPSQSGFRLEPGSNNPQMVSADWRGRVWGRTNCTFNTDGSPISGSGGTACETGDCGHFVECHGAGNPPATLAEFTFTSAENQAYYDLSLVDGYNLPMGIISLRGSANDVNLTDIPPNLTNPVCIGTASLLAPIGDASDATFGTNSSYPLPLEQSLTNAFVQSWCPWPLLLNPPSKPGDDVYPYPDDKIKRPPFNPCLSACAKWSDPSYCCTGKYDSPNSCRPSYYSMQAKRVCPDAYTFAFDDQKSTFIIPQGGGFEIVFCPASRSSNILNTFGDLLRQVAQNGHVARNVNELAQNTTYIREKNSGSGLRPSKYSVALAIGLIWVGVS